MQYRYSLSDHDKSNTVTSFVIDSDARVECGSDHALLICTIAFADKPRVSWSFNNPLHYNLHEADFPAYQKSLDTAVTLSLSKFSELSTTEMLGLITDTIDTSAKGTFGIKIKKKKQGRKLPRDVISLIQRKNTLAKSLDPPSALFTQ